MNIKRAFIGTIGATAIIAGISGKKGLNVGMKWGFGAGMTAGVIGSTIFVLGKNMIKRKSCLNVKEQD